MGFEHFATLRLDAAIRLRIALRAMRLAGSYHLQVAATEDDDRSAWDAFLVKVPRAPYQQSSLWAKVKAGQGWRSARMTVTRDGSIHAGAQLLYRAIPLAGAVGFVACGPILASDDPALAATAAEGLQRLAAACNVIYLIVQPTRGAWRSWRPIYSGTGTGPRPRSWRHTTPRRVYWT